MNKPLLNNYLMDLLTQPINQSRRHADTIFSKRSRESYFAMMEVAQRNLSIVDAKEKNDEILLKKVT